MKTLTWGQLAKIQVKSPGSYFFVIKTLTLEELSTNAEG